MAEYCVTVTDSGIEHGGVHLDTERLSSFFAHEAEDFYAFAAAFRGVSSFSSQDPRDTRLLGTIKRYGEPVGGFSHFVKSDFGSLINNVRLTMVPESLGDNRKRYSEGEIVLDEMADRLVIETPRYFNFLQNLSEGVGEFSNGVVPNLTIFRNKNVRDIMLKTALGENSSEGDLLGWDIRFIQKYVRYSLDALNGDVEISIPVDMKDGSVVNLPFSAVVDQDNLVDSYLERRVEEALTS